MRSIFKSLAKNFLQGLVLLGPLTVTAYCVYAVFTNIDKAIPALSKISPGVGFITIIGFITLVGFIGDRFFLTRWLISGFDAILEKIPGIKFIYTSTKDIISSFVGDKKKFNHPVWVKTQSQPDVWRIGFLTQPAMSLKHVEGKVAVYLPHSYAISGWVIITDMANVIHIKDMTSSQAMKFAVSGGVAGLEEDEHIEK
ncbi:MAG: DUF502 domain-containing protein [Taibaiella sp.]|nr:DUF502 domain-containing protein [Taibaiella sp.]